MRSDIQKSELRLEGTCLTYLKNIIFAKRVRFFLHDNIF
jgi:hypothetical protein